MVERTVEAVTVERVSVGPEAIAVQDDTKVVGLLHLPVQCSGAAICVAGVLECRGRDCLIRRDRIAELNRTTDEPGRTGERSGVDECLTVSLVDVHVPDVENDHSEQQQHGQEQREEHDDLTALVVRVAAAPPCAPFPLHSSSPEDVGSHCAPLSAECESHAQAT